MMSSHFAGTRPGLLVSVRTASEAIDALAGGADVIDVKEPKRGSLGAADASTIAEVVRAVNGRALVTAALGELAELSNDGLQPKRASIPAGVSLFKIGLAGYQENANWPSLWQNAIARLLNHEPSRAARPVAVVYADWRAAKAPDPNQVLRVAVQAGCPALLVDTWHKSSGSLFDHWPVNELRHFMHDVRSSGMAVVLAGSLAGTAIAQAACLVPDLVAVRTAACDAGRTGTVSRERVWALKRSIDRTVPATHWPLMGQQC